MSMTRLYHLFRVAAPALGIALALGACGDDPFALRWQSNPDTAALFSLARTELNLESVFDLKARQARVLESPDATDQWDFAVDTRNGELVLVAPGAVGLTSEARLSTLEGETFSSASQAPRDTTLYVADEPLVLRIGTVYVIKTRRQRDNFGQFCSFFGKLEPLVIQAERGRVSFQYDMNPICDDRSLVPAN